jgi:hypothetical protein
MPARSLARLARLAAAFVATIALLTACGNGDNTAVKPVRIAPKLIHPSSGN